MNKGTVIAIMVAIAVAGIVQYPAHPIDRIVDAAADKLRGFRRLAASKAGPAAIKPSGELVKDYTTMVEAEAQARSQAAANESRGATSGLSSSTSGAASRDLGFNSKPVGVTV